jgi:hypothetical protein
LGKFFQKINGVAANYFLGVILMAATLARRKTVGLGVGFPTALFSGGVRGGKYENFSELRFRK